MNWTSLDTVSMDHANRRLVNISVYFAIYPLDVYHLLDRFNLIPDTLSYFKTSEDTETRQYDKEPMLDMFWNEVLSIDILASVLFLSETQITDKIYQQFTNNYKTDHIYNKIIQDLKSHDIKENENVLNTSKTGNLFRIADSLLYNYDINGTQCLMILFVLIPEILTEFHD